MDFNKYFLYSDGQIFWKARPASDFESLKGYRVHLARYAGRRAGNLGKNGYWVARVDGRLQLVHRIIWQMHNRPLVDKEEIDHEDTDPGNNLISNLRLASSSQNKWNMNTPSHNTSGFKGVSLHKATGRYSAYYKKNGKKIHIGYFGTAAEAHAAYAKASDQNFHEFANHG